MSILELTFLNFAALSTRQGLEPSTNGGVCASKRHLRTGCTRVNRAARNENVAPAAKKRRQQSNKRRQFFVSQVDKYFFATTTATMTWVEAIPGIVALSACCMVAISSTFLQRRHKYRGMFDTRVSCVCVCSCVCLTLVVVWLKITLCFDQ